jgi:transposase
MHNKDLINIVKNFYNNNNFSIRKTSEIFNIPKSTIHRWLHFNVSLNNKSSRANIENINKFKNFIHDELQIYPFNRAIDLQNKIFSKFNIKISLSSIYIYTHQLGFKFKKISKRNFTNKNFLSKQRQNFENKIKNIKYNDIVCIDESYFFSNSLNDYGWLHKNSETYVHNKANPIKYTLLMAINSNKIISYEILKNKNTDQTLFLNFLKNKVFPLCHNKYILMDNAKFHKSKIISDLFDNSNNKSLFIPPYSPQFNPIENVFGIIKNKYKYCNNNNNDNNDNTSIIENIISKFNLDLFYFYEHAFNNSTKINNVFI